MPLSEDVVVLLKFVPEGECEGHMSLSLALFVKKDTYFNSGDYLVQILGRMALSPVPAGYVSQTFSEGFGSDTNYTFVRPSNLVGKTLGLIDVEDSWSIQKYLKAVASRYHPYLASQYENAMVCRTPLHLRDSEV